MQTGKDRRTDGIGQSRGRPFFYVVVVKVVVVVVVVVVRRSMGEQLVAAAFLPDDPTRRPTAAASAERPSPSKNEPCPALEGRDKETRFLRAA